MAIISTYNVFSATSDEPLHLAAGMQLLSDGIYTYERQHPPLSRLFIALGPYLSGLRSLGEAHIWTEGWALIIHSPDPDRTLVLARAGILPFFWVMAFGTWLWTARYHGRIAAALAVLMVATSPTVLAHAGLATTDMAVTAFMVCALYFLTRWIEAPSLAVACAFGLSAGLAVGSKFTSIPFIFFAGAALAISRWLIERPGWALRDWIAPGCAARVGASLACTMVVLWACYGFSFQLEALRTAADRPHGLVDMIVPPGSALHGFAYGMVEARIYPTFGAGILEGLREVERHFARGHLAFLLGEISMDGWWYYFPVALLVKTQVPLLALAAAGSAGLLLRACSARSFTTAAPVVIFAAILAYSTTSTIDIGVRHVLIAFPLFGIAAAAGTTQAFEARGRALAGVSAALVAWQVAGAAFAYPNYLAYFNVLAGDAPERVLVDSNLDWGQDVKRLKQEIRDRGIRKIHVSIAGYEEIESKVLPVAEPLPANSPVSGWIAVSLTKLALSHQELAWLDRHEPVARVGSSIKLYHVVPGQ